LIFSKAEQIFTRRGEGQKTTVVWRGIALDDEVRKDQKGKPRKKLREE
jgi:hypothetical protein